MYTFHYSASLFSSPLLSLSASLSPRKHEVTNMDLHFHQVGSHSRLFESLSSMMSRSALNPADISIVRILSTKGGRPYNYFSDDICTHLHIHLVDNIIFSVIQTLCRGGSTTSCAVLTDSSTARSEQTRLVVCVCFMWCAFPLQSCWCKHSSNLGQPSTKTTRRSISTSSPMLPACMTTKMERGVCVCHIVQEGKHWLNV